MTYHLQKCYTVAFAIRVLISNMGFKVVDGRGNTYPLPSGVSVEKTISNLLSSSTAKSKKRENEKSEKGVKRAKKAKV